MGNWWRAGVDRWRNIGWREESRALEAGKRVEKSATGRESEKKRREGWRDTGAQPDSK